MAVQTGALREDDAHGYVNHGDSVVATPPGNRIAVLLTIAALCGPDECGKKKATDQTLQTKESK